jgi:hypothetical protein
MNKHANPLDSIIDFAWSAGADLFFVNNAKDELKRLRTQIQELEITVEYLRETQGKIYDNQQ